MIWIDSFLNWVCRYECDIGHQFLIKWSTRLLSVMYQNENCSEIMTFLTRCIYLNIPYYYYLHMCLIWYMNLHCRNYRTDLCPNVPPWIWQYARSEDWLSHQLPAMQALWLLNPSSPVGEIIIFRRVYLGLFGDTSR